MKPKFLSFTNKEAQEFQSDFAKWSLEEKIDKSSVIVVFRYQQNGTQVDAVIDQILKNDQRESFRLSTGDTFPLDGLHSKPSTETNVSLIGFFTGTPAKIQHTLAIQDGKIIGLGDVPMDDLTAQLGR